MSRNKQSLDLIKTDTLLTSLIFAKVLKIKDVQEVTQEDVDKRLFYIKDLDESQEDFLMIKSNFQCDGSLGFIAKSLADMCNSLLLELYIPFSANGKIEKIKHISYKVSDFKLTIEKVKEPESVLLEYDITLELPCVAIVKYLNKNGV